MHRNLNLTVETEEDSFTSSFLEIAAENDVDRFKSFVERDPSSIDEIGLWYLRKSGSNQMVYEERTPLMVAATYGSLDVLDLILISLSDSSSDGGVNRRVGPEGMTALHCAASGGAVNSVEAAKRLLSAGADVNLTDAHGRKPVDVIVVPPNDAAAMKMMMEEILGGGKRNSPSCTSSSPPSSLSPEDEDDDGGLSPCSNSTCSPKKKEYPIDPSIPDIKNSIVYASDEFRMFSFKVRPCSRAYSHDWTECPFVHPGENARRRDPRKYHYSCVPCPDFRKGACRRGDLCEYAHGVFECWLHPAQYRTRMCKDGFGCARRVCFFAHTNEELRPLFVSTGSAVPSPRSMMEMLPNPFTPPISPSGLSSSSPWLQQNLPALHLPGSNGLQSSRLRASLNARDMHVGDDVSLVSDFRAQHLNELCFSPNQARMASLVGNRSSQVRSKALSPSNLDDLFNAEISSPLRYSSDQGGAFLPSQKSFNPINSTHSNQISGHNNLLHASLEIPSPIKMSPRGIEQHSPLSSRLSAFARQEKLNQLRSLSSSELSSSWADWGSPNGKLAWGVNGEELGILNRISSKIDEPDVSWVQSLVSPPESRGKIAVHTGASDCGDDEGDNPNGQIEEHAVLGAWLENMQLDPLVT